MLTYKRGVGWVETPEETIVIMGTTYRCEDRKPESGELGCWQWSAKRAGTMYYRSHKTWLNWFATNYTYVESNTQTWLIQSSGFTEDDKNNQEWVTFVPC